MINLTNGNPQDLSGLIVPNGSISFQLNTDAMVIAAPYGFVAAEQVVVFQFNAAGAIQPNSPAAAAQIYSNLELNPQNSIGLGTYYLVTFYDANGARINNTPMWWQFPQAANTTVDIGQMTPFSTIGGNVIFYPTVFPIVPPGISSLGGIFANAGATSKWVSAINTDGTVTLTQPAFSDISGTIDSSQLPSPLIVPGIFTAAIFNATTGFTINSLAAVSGHVLRGNGTNYVDAVLAAADLSNGVTGSGAVALAAGPTFTGTLTGAVISASTGFRNGTMTAGRVLRSDGTNFIAAQLAAADLSNGVTGTGTVVLAASPTITGTLTTAALAPTTALAAASQPTFRLTDSELTLNFAGSTTITGSVAASRNNITLGATTTIAAGFLYGAQGKLTLSGTLANGSGFNAGVFGQLDTSAGTFAHSSGYLAPIIGDFGATANLVSDTNANMVALLNTTNCIINAALLFIGNASYAMDFTDLAFGGAHFVQAQSGITTLSQSLKVRVNGVDYYIPLCTGTT